MNDKFIEQNIYSKDGKLLLAKGQKISQDIIRKIKKYDLELIQNDLEQDSIKLPVITESLKKKFNIRNNNLLNNSSELLTKIIFDSKMQPWWLYVNALGNYIDWLYSHSIDVALISLMIAFKLKFKPHELWNIGIGSFLHDVGKLLIPKAIIEKKGSLNEQEWILMRQHCELGKSSLQSCNLPQECLDIVSQHHERMDGSGYPNGLTDKEISYMAKIVMIADVIDAVTSYRPYKRIQNMNEALKFLKKTDSQFSKEIIQIIEGLFA